MCCPAGPTVNRGNLSQRRPKSHQQRRIVLRTYRLDSVNDPSVGVIDREQRLHPQAVCQNVPIAHPQRQ